MCTDLRAEADTATGPCAAAAAAAGTHAESGPITQAVRLTTAPTRLLWEQKPTWRCYVTRSRPAQRRRSQGQRQVTPHPGAAVCSEQTVDASGLQTVTSGAGLPLRSSGCREPEGDAESHPKPSLYRNTWGVGTVLCPSLERPGFKENECEFEKKQNQTKENSMGDWAVRLVAQTQPLRLSVLVSETGASRDTVSTPNPVC